MNQILRGENPAETEYPARQERENAPQPDFGSENATKYSKGK